MWVPLLHYPSSHPWNVYYALSSPPALVSNSLHTVYIRSPKTINPEKKRLYFSPLFEDFIIKPRKCMWWKKWRDVKNVRRTQRNRNSNCLICCMNSNKKRLTTVPAEVMLSGNDSVGVVVRLKFIWKALFVQQITQRLQTIIPLHTATKPSSVVNDGHNEIPLNPTTHLCRVYACTPAALWKCSE